MGQGNGVLKTTDDEWDRTMNVNARATFALARALLPGMVKRKFGA
jgi:NAD(P)-dependent dehydrogenase (short-subunit alcohol dehydrogenase family)